MRPQEIIPKSILSNPGIVIYSASWATLIAVLVVVIWLHRRKMNGKEKTAAPKSAEEPGTETDTKEK
jgi:hypothetical protein